MKTPCQKPKPHENTPILALLTDGISSGWFQAKAHLPPGMTGQKTGNPLAYFHMIGDDDDRFYWLYIERLGFSCANIRYAAGSQKNSMPVPIMILTGPVVLFGSFFLFEGNDKAIITYINDYLETHDQVPLTSGTKFCRVEIDDFALRVERHTEFVSVSFIEKAQKPQPALRQMPLIQRPARTCLLHG